MESEPAQPAPFGEPSHISPIGRVFGIFWEPKRTFTDIIAKPGWWVPMVMLILFGLVLMYTFNQTIGIESLLRQQFETNSRLQELSAEQRNQAIAVQLRIVPYTMYAGALIGPPVVYMLIALVLMYAFRITAGSQVNFKQSFAITTHSFLPGMLHTVLAIIVMQFVHPDDFDLQNPVMSNLGWLLGESSPAWLNAFARSFDLFAFWYVALLAMGFAAATRKLRFGKAFMTILGLWFVMVLIGTGWAAMFS